MQGTGTRLVLPGNILLRQTTARTDRRLYDALKKVANTDNPPIPNVLTDAPFVRLPASFTGRFAEVIQFTFGYIRRDERYRQFVVLDSNGNLVERAVKRLLSPKRWNIELRDVDESQMRGKVWDIS